MLTSVNDLLVQYPIWENDRKSIIHLNDLQKRKINEFLQEIKDGQINFESNLCLCGNKDKSLDIVVAEKDRYGIPCINVLLKKYYLQHIFKLNPYYYKVGLIKILDMLGIKNIVKKILGKS